MTSGRVEGDEGFTLVEMLLAIAILGIACVAFVTALATIVMATEHHRGATSVDAELRSFAEAVKAVPVTEQCPGPAAFDAAKAVVSAGYSPEVTKVEYWVPKADPRDGEWVDQGTCMAHYQRACSSDCQIGMERVGLSMRSSKSNERGAFGETRVIVRRGNPQ